VAGNTVRQLALLHGVNLDMLGQRPKEHYGTLTLAELESRVRRYAQQRGFETHSFQTNHEGVMVDHLHDLAVGGVDAIIFNPGAWTHYSYAIRDALELVPVPVAEVHLSAVDEREEWRRTSVIADLSVVRIAGKGLEGYLEAVDRLAREVGAGRAPARGYPSDE
jgi:3-dehydroquinate dehydratase II